MARKALRGSGQRTNRVRSGAISLLPYRPTKVQNSWSVPHRSMRRRKVTGMTCAGNRTCLSNGRTERVVPRSVAVTSESDVAARRETNGRVCLLPRPSWTAGPPGRLRTTSRCHPPKLIGGTNLRQRATLLSAAGHINVNRADLTHRCGLSHDPIKIRPYIVTRMRRRYSRRGNHPNGHESIVDRIFSLAKS